MALILSFPIHKISIPKQFIDRDKQQLLVFPLKSSIAEKQQDWDELIFEMELEKVRAKCALELPAEKGNTGSMRNRLVISLGKCLGLFIVRQR